MKELSKLKIAYWPCNQNKDVPGDKFKQKEAEWYRKQEKEELSQQNRTLLL